MERRAVVDILIARGAETAVAYKEKILFGVQRVIRNTGLVVAVLLLTSTSVSAQQPKPKHAVEPESGIKLPEEAIPLQSEEKIWIDKKRNRILLEGEVCLRQGPLELLVCPWNGKLHESIIRVHSKPSTIHAGLLAVGGEPGVPVSYSADQYQPASGGVVEIIIQWKDEQGQLQEAHGQDWVRHRDVRADLQNSRHVEIIKRAKNSSADQSMIDGKVEAYWVPVHPAFRDRVEREAKRQKRHVIRPSAAGKQIEQLMVLSDPRVLNPDVPEPEKFYRTQFSPAKRDNPQHQKVIQLSGEQQGDEIRINGRLRARWEATFPQQKDTIAADQNNVIRPSPGGRQLEELIVRGIPLEHDWIFAGSRIVDNPETGEAFYVADRSGEIVCVSNFPTAMIDLPIESSAENAHLGFEASTENIPPKKTAVRVILMPHALQNDPNSGE